MPIKTRDDLSMAYTPGRRAGLPGDRRGSGDGLEPDDQAQHRRGRDRRQRGARSRRHRSCRGDAGDGGQGPAVQGVRRRRRLADLPRHQGHRRRSSPRSRRSRPGFGGINLEDIAAPRCFEVERRLRESLDIPVFHDDQHGTAVVVLAAFLNALRVVGKRIEDVRVVVTGVGAAGVAVTETLQAAGVRHVIGADSTGTIYRGRPGLTPVKELLRREHQPGQLLRHRGRGAGRRRRVPRALAAGRGERLRGSRTMAPRRDRLRDGQPDARGDAGRDRRASPRSSRPGAPTFPTRSTTCSPSRASSAARSTCARVRSPSGWRSPPATRSPRPSATTSWRRLHRAERLQPRGGRRRRRGGRCGGGRRRRLTPRPGAGRGRRLSRAGSAEDRHERAVAAGHGQLPQRQRGLPWLPDADDRRRGAVARIDLGGDHEPAARRPGDA